LDVSGIGFNAAQNGWATNPDVVNFRVDLDKFTEPNRRPGRRADKFDIACKEPPPGGIFLWRGKEGASPLLLLIPRH